MGLLSINLASAQLQVENFEGTSLPAGWTTNVVSGTIDWTFGSGLMPSGTSFTSNAAIFDDDAAGEEELDNTVELLSPVIDLTNYSAITLSFEYAIQDYIGAGYFNADVWDGTQWVQILTATDDQNPIVANFDVTAYANPTFQVKFTYGDDQEWAWGAGVDNFSLSGTLGSNDFQQNKISLYPNPSSDFVNINSETEITNIRVVDTNGRIIESIANGTNRVDVTTLAKGVYVLQYETNGKSYTTKVVKK